MTTRMLLVVLVLSLFGNARADAPALQQAEDALHALQFDDAREAAHRAIELGGLSEAELARSYEIIGLCAASVGSVAEAQAAYLRMLALRPDAGPSDTLPPAKNRPFYEAQGFWLARQERLSMDLHLDAAGVLRVQVVDPLGMAAGISYLEPPRPDSRVREPWPAGTSQRELHLFRAGGRTAFEVTLLDEHENVLLRRAGEFVPPQPQVPLPPVVAVSAPERVLPHAPPPERERSRAWRSPWLWGAVGLAVACAVTTTVWLARERAPVVQTDLAVGKP